MGLAAVQDVRILTKPTKPIEGQKTGTSGLRKKTNVFMGENYLANWYGLGASVQQQSISSL